MALGYLILSTTQSLLAHFLGLAILPWACPLVSLSSKAEVTCPLAKRSLPFPASEAGGIREAED